MFHPFFHEHAGRHSRLFEKGDLKYVVLDLLKDKPAHGYEIIRALEDRFHGFYTPSAGSVYPTLQLLEDMDYVKSAEQDGKKVYTITEAGMNFLKERKETADKIRGKMRDWWGSERVDNVRDSIVSLREIQHSMVKAARSNDIEKLGKIKEIIVKARKDIEDVSNKQ